MKNEYYFQTDYQGMEEIQDTKQLQIDQNLQQQLQQDSIVNIQPNSSQSQHLSTYLNLIGLDNIESLQTHRQSALQKLAIRHLKYDESDEHHKLQFNIVDATRNYQYLGLNVRYNKILFKISILNIDEESPTHKIKKCYKGNFSTVYHTIHKCENIAIKCSKFKNRTFLKVLRNTLLEYLTFKVAAALQVGPRMTNLFWFDLIIYKDCIQFSMQFCNHKHKIQTLKTDLTLSLQNLHCLKIIHFDIKPENICFSQSFNKNIFIDFGLHRVITQQIGQKSLTFFNGSLLFCSAQMRQCFAKGETFVDLYYNDAFCLNQSIKQIEMKGHQEIFQIKAQPYKQPSLFNLIRIKFVLLKINQFPYFDTKLLKQHLYDKIQQLKSIQLSQITSFISFLNYSQNFQPVIYTIQKKKKTLDLQVGQIAQAKFINQFKSADRNQKNQQRQNIFKRRMNALKYLTNVQTIQSGNLHLLNHQKQYIEFLSNANNISKWEINIYFQHFAQMLQVNSWAVPIKNKHHLCNIFNIVYLSVDQFDKLDIDDKMIKCFRRIGQFLKQQLQMTNSTFFIIKNSLLSIILLQVYTKQQLQYFLINLMKKKSSFKKSIRLFFHILSCLQWTRFIRSSIYCYFYFKKLAFSLINYKLAEEKTNQQQALLLKFLQRFVSKLQSKKELLKQTLSDIFVCERFKILNFFNSVSEYDQILSEIYVYIVYELKDKYKEHLSLDYIVMLQIYKQEEQIKSMYYFQFIIYMELISNQNKYQKVIQTAFQQLPSLKCFQNIYFLNSQNNNQFYYQKEQKIYFHKKYFSKYLNCASLYYYIEGINVYHFIICDNLKLDVHKYDKQSLMANLSFYQIHQFCIELIKISNDKDMHDHKVIQRSIFYLIRKYILLMRSIGEQLNVDFIKSQIDYFANNIQCYKCKAVFLINSFINLNNQVYFQEQEQQLKLVIWLFQSNIANIRQTSYLLIKIAQTKDTYNYHKLYVQYLLYKKKQLIIIINPFTSIQFQAKTLNMLWKERYNLQIANQSIYFTLIDRICIHLVFQKSNLQQHLIRFHKILKEFLFSYIAQQQQTYKDFIDFNINYFHINKHKLKKKEWFSIYFAFILIILIGKSLQYIQHSYYYYIWSTFHIFALPIKQLANHYVYRSYLQNQKQCNLSSKRKIYQIEKKLQIAINSSTIFTISILEHYDKLLKKNLLQFRKKVGKNTLQYKLMKSNFEKYYSIK